MVVDIEAYDLFPSLAVSNEVSPLGWSQIWSHLLANAVNSSRISTSKAPQLALGAGGRWFESSRPDQLLPSSPHRPWAIRRNSRELEHCLGLVRRASRW